MDVFWYYLPDGLETYSHAKCGKLKAATEEAAISDLCRQLGRRQLPDGVLLVRWSDDAYNGPLSKDPLGSKGHSLDWNDVAGRAHIMPPSQKYAM